MDYNIITSVIIHYILHFQCISAYTIETIRNFGPTQEFHGLFIRGINSNTVYLGNYYKDILYNTKSNQIITSYSQITKCASGTICPFIIKNTNYPKYVLWKKLGTITLAKYSSINDKDGNKKEGKHTDITIADARGFIQINDTMIIALSRFQDGDFSVAKRGLVFIDLNSDFSSFHSVTSHNTRDIGVLVLTNGKVLVFSMYNSLYYTFLNLNELPMKTEFVSDNWISITTNGLVPQDSTYQMMEFEDKKVIFCIYSSSEHKIICGNGIYTENDKFTLTDINYSYIGTCDGDGYNFFSLYKLNNTHGIIGCGFKTLQLKRISYEITRNEPIIKISKDNGIFMDFSLLSVSRMYIAIASRESSNYYYYSTIITYPFCVSKRRNIKSNNNYYLSNLFTSDETQGSTGVIIASLPVNGKLFYNDIWIDQVNYTTYESEQIYYFSSISIGDQFQYQGTATIQGGFFVSPICTASFGICYESCLTCNNYGNADNHNCIKCENNYYKDFIKTTICYNSTSKPYNYYLDNQDSTYKKCPIECYSCSQKNNDNIPTCDVCDKAHGYFPLAEEPSQCKSVNEENYWIYFI